MDDATELDRLRETVEAALRDHLDQVLPRLVELHPALVEVADELRAFVLGGGKRLRPLFVLAGHRAAGGSDPEVVMGAALAVELLHTCALLHDDVIDSAVTRRGRPSAHVHFARRHREEGWHGSDEGYGRAVAILLGDLAFAHADSLLRTCRVAPARLLEGWDVFTTLREEVTAGQYLDLYAAHSGRTDTELALTVASYKAGRYTVARPLQLGATLAGAGSVLVEGLLRFGLPLGQAFQLRDDVLGAFGTEQDTGKPVAGDLAEGKRTLLVAETAQRLEGERRARFERLVATGARASRDVRVVQAFMRDSGGLAATERRIEELARQAREVLGTLDISADAARLLENLARGLTDRRG